MILSSDATWDGQKGTGDPTEIALLMFGDDIGLDRTELEKNTRRIGELAFDSDRKLMSTLVEEDGRLSVYTKGAIDNLLGICTHVLVNGNILPMTDQMKEKFNQAAIKMAASALRTLGAAYKPVEKPIEDSQMEKDLILIGIVGLMDPPRPEVKHSIDKAKKAGIITVMITGDHKNTAFAIAQELGIADTLQQVITGLEIDEMSEAEFSKRLCNTGSLPGFHPNIK
jgi:Ca2+-transporting ATPase